MIAHGKLVIPRRSKIQPPTPEDQNRSVSYRLAPDCPSHPSTRSALLAPSGISKYLSHSSSNRASKCARLRISTQNRIPHIAMRLNPTTAWRASPTRTPPPICTSAPFL